MLSLENPNYNMSIAPKPSIVTLPPCELPYPTLLEFFVQRFPQIPVEIWITRFEQQKIRDEKGEEITKDFPYQPGFRIFYYREVVEEPQLPWDEAILYEDDHLLVVDKPHFMPVTPGGPWVNNCLLHRLINSTGNISLVPLHRIDRETAGLVLFSTNQSTRGDYQQLFMEGLFEKTYQAIAELEPASQLAEWELAHHITKGKPFFRMKIADGPINARATIRMHSKKKGDGFFYLYPQTGKKHQLRLQMAEIGYPILNDKYYPTLQEQRGDDPDYPLQLLAKEICFIDPITREDRMFTSNLELNW
jgi:tRNA pseudouridine32 synthase/23S rRNA pseudouridine746 synthase